MEGQYMDTIPNITHLIGQGPTDDEVEEQWSPIMNEDYKSFSAGHSDVQHNR